MTDQPSATDQTALRDRIAEALARSLHPDLSDEAPPKDHPFWSVYQRHAAAVLAVLPATVDRAAVRAAALHEGADALLALNPAEAALAGQHAWADGAALLRRLAEAQQDRCSCGGRGIQHFHADDHQPAREAQQDRHMATPDAIAYRIRAELVCCDLYDRINVRKELTIAQAMESQDWHDLCYWGEASAQIAEGRCPGYETQPNICRCDCEGCKHNCAAHQAREARQDEGEHVCKPGASVYYCSTSGENESNCHGGFDICCDRPDLHQPAREARQEGSL